MKNILFNFITFCAFALFTQNLTAQTISAADQKGVNDCYNAFMTAFEKMDVAAMGPLFTDNAEQIIPTGEILRGRANILASMTGYMEFLKSQPKPDRTSVKNIAQQYRYLATDLVLSTYTEEFTRYFGSESKVEKTSTAVLLRKSKDKWLVELITLTPSTPMPEMGK